MSLRFSNSHIHIDPVGSALPKFSSKDKINAFAIEKSSVLSLTCPAQGHPLPAFRFVNFLFFLSNANV